jgi:EAL domain-containing protein (putative c-di-GMP-specific phosphodiesterase class I)
MSTCTNGSGDCQRTSHNCTCRLPVVDLPSQGIALWSDSPVVGSKLAATLPMQDDAPGVFRILSTDWTERLESILDSLSPLERNTIRGAYLDGSGKCDPWKAVTAESLLIQARSAWLPGVLNERRLVSYLQPIVRSSDRSVFAYEALARAEVDGQLKNGGDLVDAARAHSALFQFDQIARTHAIRSCGPKLEGDEKLFVNFLPMVIYDPKICLQTCWEAAQDAGIALSSLVFEVVESEAFPDIAHLKRILEHYQEQGAGVALDDLGTGHTALSYIDELNPDYIKLAKGLVPEQPRFSDLHLVRGIVEHAKRRDITVLLEGVETEDQFSAAQDLGIDLIQGYLTGRPAAEPVRTQPEQSRRAA